MLVHLRDGSAQTVARAATLRQKWLIKVAISPTHLHNADTGPTSPSSGLISPGAWRGSHWSVNFEVTGMARPGKRPTANAGIKRRSAALEVDTSPQGQRGMRTVMMKTTTI